MRAFQVWRGLVIVGLIAPSPTVWAQALEVERPEHILQDVTTRVEQLKAEVASKDPELAQEIDRQAQVCEKDLQDGKLDDPGLVKEVETYREVQRELSERVVASEMEKRATELARTNPEAADRMRTAMEAFRRGGGDTALARPEFGGPTGGGEALHGEVMQETMRGQFEQAYQEVLKHDPEGAQHMKEMFEATERGEAMRPTPEMMERMHGEMERYMSEHPEKAEYAKAEWDRMMDHGMDRSERSGAMETPEQQREGFERWASESGKSAEEITRMRETMERGFEHMATREETERGFANGAHDMEHLREMGDAGRTEAREAFERWAESPEARSVDREQMEHFREMAERSFEGRSEADREAMEHEREVWERERDYSTILENRTVEPVAGSGGGGTEHTFSRDLDGPNSEWTGPNGIHEHVDGTTPHSQ